MTFDEMDRLAAEKIMGWVNTGEAPNGFNPFWSPTRNIAQAWELLEKLPRESAFHVSIVRSFMGWRCNLLTQQEFEVDFAEGGHGTFVAEYMESSSEAITRACLKAVGVDVEMWSE